MRLLSHLWERVDGLRGRGDWEATTGVNTKKRYSKEISHKTLLKLRRT